MTVISPTNDLTAFIPEVYSKKLARVAKKFSKFIERNCNREWEGEIRAFGDVVRIALPDPSNIAIAMGTNTKDVCPVASGVEPTETALEINHIATYSLKFSDVDQVQSQFNLLEGYNGLAMQKIGDRKDKQVMVALINDAKVGKIGTAAAPQAVTKDTIYDQVIDAKIKLMNAGAINGEGFYSFKGNSEEVEYLAPVLTVSPAIYGLMLKSTQLTHPTVAGDNVIKAGEQAMMGGFEIDVNTVLTAINKDLDTGLALDVPEVAGLADGAEIAIACTKMAITYANQYTKVEKLRDPDCFADIIRALELYGFEVIHPESAVILFLTQA